MKREIGTIAGLAILALSVVGCQSTAGSQPGPGTTAAIAAASPPAVGWPMPNQLTQAPGSAGQPTAVSWVAGFGFVRGTPQALARLASPLEPKPGRNRAVEACREVVEKTAAPLGAVRVEVVSAGPDRRVRGGAYAGPVETRIVYSGTRTLEVREATLTCTVDARGNVLGAEA